MLLLDFREVDLLDELLVLPFKLLVSLLVLQCSLIESLLHALAPYTLVGEVIKLGNDTIISSPSTQILLLSEGRYQLRHSVLDLKKLLLQFGPL